MTDIERRGGGYDRTTGEIVREDAGGRTMQRTTETAQSAMAAQATAQTQAMYIMARQNPRSWDVVRTRLLDDCKRVSFAKAAIYRKPQRMKDDRGNWYNGHLEGLSIRFAEDAQRLSGNIRAGAMAIYDDDEKRIVMVYATDLETNATVEQSVTITKTVERSGRGIDGRIIVATRLNSAKEEVHLVEATEDEIRQKELGAVARAKRNLVLSLIPADIREDAEKQARATREAEAAKDPNAARKSVVDAFWEQRVPASELETYVGHPLDQCSPAEIETLRGLYVAIKEGDVIWHELLAERSKPAEEQKPNTTKAQQIAERVRSKRGAKATDAGKAPAAADASSSSTTGTSTAPSTSTKDKPAAGAAAQTTLPAASSSTAPKNTHRGEATDGEPPPNVKLEGDR